MNDKNSSEISVNNLEDIDPETGKPFIICPACDDSGTVPVWEQDDADNWLIVGEKPCPKCKERDDFQKNE